MKSLSGKLFVMSSIEIVVIFIKCVFKLFLFLIGSKN